ncbi:MAG: hypothetical protein CMG08_04745 [Candidatus Marinimicrobia bacterium]|nr:hypothetical protein [Candidatus Neomarinimicrobiota bacterium]
MFDKGNMFSALKQAQNMKKQLKRVNKQLEKSHFTSSSNNNEIEVKINGKMKLLSIKLDDNFSSLDNNSKERLLVSTINNAIDIAQKESQNQMNAVTGGMLGDMKIPGL